MNFHAQSELNEQKLGLPAQNRTKMHCQRLAVNRRPQGVFNGLSSVKITHFFVVEAQP